MEPLRHEVDEFYQRYDNDTLSVFMAKALRGLGVIFLLCFLLWPLGLYRSQDWLPVSVSEFNRDSENEVSLPMVGYWVDGQFYSFCTHYFGGNPPAIFGKLGLSRPTSVLYNPRDPSSHVSTKAPSWMTILLPLFAVITFHYSKQAYRPASPGAEARAHPYDPRKEKNA